MTVVASRFSRTRFCGGFSGVDRLRSNLGQLSKCGVYLMFQPYKNKYKEKSGKFKRQCENMVKNWRKGDQK